MRIVYFLTVFPIPSCVLLLNMFRYLRGERTVAARTAVAASIPVLLLSFLPAVLPVEDISLYLLPAAFCVGCFLLLNESAEEKEGKVSGWITILLCLVFIVLSFLVRSPSGMALAVYLCLFCGQAAYSACRLSIRRDRIREWTRSSAVPDWAEDLRRLSLRLCILLVAFLSMMLPSRIWTLVIGGLFALLALRNWRGQPLLANYRFETELRDLSSVSARRSTLPSGESVDRELYERCCALMDERRPFLVEDFSLADLARSLYTNKVYLSRSINHFSGKNFRQFVNYYRVKYAIEQFSANKHLRVSELAMLSGFHSTVSFNMAFKIVTGETPSDWKRMHQKDARKEVRKP